MAYPPFPKHTDYLQIYTEEVYSGNHIRNIRETFSPVSGSTVYNTFTAYSGTGTKTGEWYFDAGDLTLSKPIRENRAYCVVGKITQVVNGTNIIVRIETESGRGTFKVKIDGVHPTAIAGVVNPLDTINCDADTSGLAKGYHDVTIAENLSAGNHTVELYAENAANVYVAVVGFKTSAFIAPNLGYTGWRADVSTALNNRTITFTNTGAYAIEQLTITPPSGVKTWAGATMGTIGPMSLAAGASYTLQFALDVTDMAASALNRTFSVSALYKDASGATQLPVTVFYDVDNPGLTFSSTGWVKDNGGPGGTRRAFSTAIGKTVTFTTSATSITVDVIKDYGWGKANVLVNGTQFAVLDSHTTGAAGSYPTVVSGMASGTKTIVFSTVNGSAKPFVFGSVTMNETANFSSVNESITAEFSMRHIPPFTPPNVRINQTDTATTPKGMITWDAITGNEIDLSDKTKPRSNQGVVERRVYSRFPTFCVYYGAGKTDILDQYDLLVIEPKAVSRKQVAAWQAKGIKVYGYVSFGEEDGERLDKWDLGATDIGPHRDDQLGTGGYASYYLKGGYESGEASECNHDRQRVEGVKACALSNPKYNTGAGRCSKACNKDWKLGYATWSAGGACGGGFTKANKWQRDAMRACSNTTCSGYTPINQKCTQFLEADVQWSQDFQMMDTFPDQNGIWNSTFINPLAPRWKEKLNTFYLPYTLGTQQQYTESLPLIAHTGATDGAKLVVQVSHYPIDDEEIMLVQTADGAHTYIANLDYSYDADNGIFSLALDAGVNDGIAAPAAGTTVKITYMKKGLNCDGVFMDTVDTVDVYPRADFQVAFANMINDLKSMWSNKMFCSNRGFSILDSIIGSCSHVMFETFISDYDFTTGEYGLITDQGAIDWNNGIKEQLKTLRKTHKFDVIALNYAPNDASGDAIRSIVTEKCYADGYMSWTSVISLQDPLAPIPVNLGKGKIRSNLWKLQFRKK